MVAKTVEAGPFRGINNKLPVHQLVGKDGAFVRDALNVDLTAAGTFQRRSGSTLAVAGARCRSLWSAGDVGYYADGPNLMAFDGADASVLATLANPAANVSFVQTPRGVVWTDGTALELIVDGSSDALCVPAPNPVPAMTTAVDGALAAGAYTVAFANVNAAGERSALVGFDVIDVPEHGAITITLGAGRAHDTQVFVSACAGSELYRHETVPAADATLRIALVTSQGAPASDEVEQPMPPGSMVRLHYGRLLTVIGNLVVFSHPFAYGLCNPAKNYVLLDAPVTLCEPVDGGVYLATANRTWFAGGPNFAAASLRSIANFGAIPGTAVNEPNSEALWWSTSRGAVRATSNGAIELKQDANVAFSNAATGAALFREENGLSQFIASLSSAAPTNGASASSYMDAETVN